MSVSRQYFKFFLVDTPSGLCYYIDAMGNIQKGNIFTGQDYSLPQSPGGWDEMQLSFGRSAHYWGLNRTFTIPLKFIGDGARIIRYLFYAGRGIESQVTLAIAKWSDATGIFSPYYTGQLDLSKIEDNVAEGVTVNIMQGGVVQMMKAYENQTFEIPCDGSIPENIKVNCDGILLNDVFHYEITPIVLPYAGDQPLPCVFVSNDGDNIGITKNNQMLEPTFAGYYQKSGNFLFSSEQPLSVRIEGTIVVRNDPSVSDTNFHIFTATSLSQPRGIDGNLLDHAAGLVLPYVPPDGIYNSVNNNLILQTQKSFSFDLTVNLSANEHLFIMVFNNFSAAPVTIVGGSFSLTFSSRYMASRVWGIRPYDLGKLLIKKMNALSSNFLQTFNYGFDSLLLQSKQNLVITSGDALRASTDPNYFQYYNQATLNPANPNNQDFTQFASLGPVIKISIADFFDSVNAVLNAALSNQQLPGEQESIFIESKSYVLDPSVITMSLTKISNFRVSIASEYFFSWLKIGYEPQQYDEKAGKYEYNSTVQWQSPIRTLSKVMEIMSKIRADSYGVEYTRYNTQGGKSATFNNSDNSKFFLNTDFTTSIPDYYSATFKSSIPNPTSATNTDQKLIASKNYQAIYTDLLDGEYFVSENDFSIFMFNQPSPGTLTELVDFTALLNGLAGDSATITMWVNGEIRTSWTQSITGVNTAFNGTFSSSRTYSKGDNIYFTVDTIRTCTVEITDLQINIGSGYWLAETTGPVNIPAGSTRQLVSLPVVTPTLVGGQPVVSFGFQYFKFLSNVNNKNFDWNFGISVYHQGNTGQNFSFDLWKNGVNIGTVGAGGNANTLTGFNNPGIDPPATQFFGNIDFQNNDLLWITCSAAAINIWVTNVLLKFTSTSIRAFNLLRAAYSNVSGIPNPETAFNTEDLTPKRMLQANSSILSPALFNLAPGSLLFQTADKNSFLSTTLAGQTISERASVDIHDLDNPLYYPLIFEFDTEVPINFSDLFNNAANGHIEFAYNNKLFYGFPIQVSAKPALNESQTWKLLCSPKTNLSDLVDLDWNGLPVLMPNNISIPIVCPLHVVPLNLVKPDVYKNASMEEDWFVNRIQAWIDQSNYAMPRQNDEPLPIQLQTNGLAPVTIQILDYKGAPVGSPVNIPQVGSSSVNAPQMLFQGNVDISTLADAIYYTLWTIGIGEAQVVFISEGIYVKQNWDASTIRLDYTNSRDKLAVVFPGTGYAPNIRIHGQINRYTPKSKFTTFVDQPQDIDLLNSIPYDTWKLEIGRSSGIPDYMMRKIARIFDLDTVLIDGNQYTRDADAQWEKQNFPGQPKEYMTLDIRRAKNSDAITYDASGQIASNAPGGYILDPAAIGQSLSGQDLVQVGS
jgi:hypothetical protein